MIPKKLKIIPTTKLPYNIQLVFTPFFISFKTPKVTNKGNIFGKQY